MKRIAILRTCALLGSALLLTAIVGTPALAAQDKETMCLKSGTPAQQTKDVNASQVDKYLDAGAYLGACDACSELNRSKYDGTYHKKILTLSFVGDEKIVFDADYSAYCPGPDGGIGAGYLFTGAWGSSGIWNCLFYDSAKVQTGALPGTAELSWYALGNMGVDPVWDVTCTHEY